VVLVAGGDVADALVQPDRVVVDAEPVELGFQLAAVAGLLQVRVLAFEVAEERLDPGLVVRRGRPAEVLAIRAPAMNAAVALLVICGPLSDSATRTGSRSSPSGISPAASSASRSPSSRSSLPSSISARVKATSTCVEDSSADTTVAS